MLGVYELSIRKISFETGLKIEEINNALKVFERIKKVKYVKNYIVLLNFAKHQNYNTNMKISAIDVYNNLPNELKFNDEVIEKSNPLEAFERVLNRLGMVRKVEVEDEDESETESESEQKPSHDFFEKDTFIDWFNASRKYLGLASNIVKLSLIEKNYFDNLKNDYSKDDFKKAFRNFSSDDYYSKRNLIFPIHFLKAENFVKYLNEKEKPKKQFEAPDLDKFRQWEDLK